MHGHPWNSDRHELLARALTEQSSSGVCGTVLPEVVVIMCLSYVHTWSSHRAAAWSTGTCRVQWLWGPGQWTARSGGGSNAWGVAAAPGSGAQAHPVQSASGSETWMCMQQPGLWGQGMCGVPGSAIAAPCEEVQ